MADGFGVKISGVDELVHELRALAPKLRVRALRNALAVGARDIQRFARARAPVLKRSTYSGASALRRGVRAVGTVRRAISVRTSKHARRDGDVGVFVNVRPLRRGGKSKAAGARNPADPYYWRWLEWGWNPATKSLDGAGALGRARRRKLTKAGSAKRKPGALFLTDAAKRLPLVLPKVLAAMLPAIEKLNRRKAPAP